MSDGVERTKRVHGKTTPAFIKFNYMEETSNLDKASKAAPVLGILSLIEGCFFFPLPHWKRQPITKNNDLNKDMRKIKESKK